MRKIAYLFIAALLVATVAEAKQYETFDGQIYNGLYYQRIDIIEWGEQNGELPHMEFHIYSKDKPIEVTAVPGNSSGKPVLWLSYDLKFRGERICRKVVAPAHFREGDKLYAYKDSSFLEYDNIFFSTQQLKGKTMVPYEQEPYQSCSDEMASNMPGTEPAASAPARVPANASAPTPNPVTAAPAAAKPKGVGVDYDNSAVPFSF